MKKIVIGFLVMMFTVSMVFIGVGCKEEAVEEVAVEEEAVEEEAVAEEEAVEETTAAEELVVAGIIISEGQFERLLTAGYADGAKDAGVKLLRANSALDQAKEVELINTYLGQKVDGIAISPIDSIISEPALKRANDAGTKVVVVNIEMEQPYILACYTSGAKDLGKSTGLVARKFIQENLGGKANIAILQYKSVVPAQSTDRVNGFLEELEGLDVKVVADQDAWMSDTSFAATGDILTANKDINIIFSANEGGTIGAAMAVKNAGLAGKVFVFGIDTSDQLLNMLLDSDNILQAVTGQDPYTEGYMAIETLVKAIKGEDVSETQGKISIVPGVLLSRDDPDGVKKYQADLEAIKAKIE